MKVKVKLSCKDLMSNGKPLFAAALASIACRALQRSNYGNA